MDFGVHSLGTVDAVETGTAFDFQGNPGPASVTINCGATWDGTVLIQVKNGDATTDEWHTYATHTEDGFTEISAPFQYIRLNCTVHTAGSALGTLCWVRK